MFRPGIHDSGHVPRPSGQLPEDETRATGTTCRWGWSSYWWIVMGGMGWLGKSMVSGFDFPNKTNPRMGWFPLKPLSTSQSQHQSDAHLQQHRLGAYRSSMRSIAVEDMPCWKCWKFPEIRNAKKWILWWVMANDWLIIVNKCLIMFNNGEFWLIMVN